MVIRETLGNEEGDDEDGEVLDDEGEGWLSSVVGCEREKVAGTCQLLVLAHEGQRRGCRLTDEACELLGGYGIGRLEGGEGVGGGGSEGEVGTIVVGLKLVACCLQRISQ